MLGPNGLLLAVAVSRFGTLLSALKRAALADPVIARMVERDIREGQHRNPTPGRASGWFTTAFFHHPEELAAEVVEAGFVLDAVFGLEGPGAFVGDWTDPGQREGMLEAARAVEREPSLLGMSSYLLAVARQDA
ncbi:MAG: hypothetical protein M3Q10_05145 [Chloroflexota bacterium]|nr:hypothetical protein [Chloroflexota bacterium]